MDYKKIKHIFLFLLVVSLFSCEAEIDQYTPDAGDIDFTTFVAVGNSLTAGFRDGDLFRSGQEHSLANIMATQFMHVGLESFKQPLMKDDLGFGNRLVLGEVNGSLLPVPIGGSPDPGNYGNIFDSEGPFHNMGVPGARTVHVLFEGYGTLNNYYGRFASNQQTSSILGDALALQPTFFSLWLGSNDILGYAMSGGEGEGITPADEFAMHYGMIVNALTQNGAKGVLANIVDITSIPFLTTVPYNAVFLNDPNIVAMLNAAYAAAEHIQFDIGLNPLVVVDTDHPAGIRQLESGELVVLTALPGITGQGWGSQTPLPLQYYLNHDQVGSINAAVAAYNDVISQMAQDHSLAYVDIRSRLEDATTGMYFDAINFTTEFVSGGLFSLDGVHLSQRGYALAANEFIAAINRQYNASIPKVTVGNFPGIIFP